MDTQREVKTSAYCHKDHTWELRDLNPDSLIPKPELKMALTTYFLVRLIEVLFTGNRIDPFYEHSYVRVLTYPVVYPSAEGIERFRHPQKVFCDFGSLFSFRLFSFPWPVATTDLISASTLLESRSRQLSSLVSLTEHNDVKIPPCRRTHQ